jgi:anthranilate phosphoribosyltransferase
VKLVNPLNADLSLQGVFHPAYLESHQQASAALSYPASLAIKGEGGEVEFRPDADNRLFIQRQGNCFIEKWPRRLSDKASALEPTQLSAEVLKTFWTSETAPDNYGLQALLGTTAMVLFAAAKADTLEEAWASAEIYWNKRDKNLFKSTS